MTVIKRQAQKADNRIETDRTRKRQTEEVENGKWGLELRGTQNQDN